MYSRGPGPLRKVTPATAATEAIRVAQAGQTINQLACFISLPPFSSPDQSVLTIHPVPDLAPIPQLGPLNPPPRQHGPAHHSPQVPVQVHQRGLAVPQRRPPTPVREGCLPARLVEAKEVGQGPGRALLGRARVGKPVGEEGDGRGDEERPCGVGGRYVRVGRTGSGGGVFERKPSVRGLDGDESDGLSGARRS